MSNIQEIINSGANVSITIGIDDLKECVLSLFENERKKLEQTIIAEKEETYSSLKQVSVMLGVDKSTLWRWKNKGYLVPIEVGGKRVYKMSDVKKMLNK